MANFLAFYGPMLLWVFALAAAITIREELRLSREREAAAFAEVQNPPAELRPIMLEIDRDCGITDPDLATRTPAPAKPARHVFGAGTMVEVTAEEMGPQPPEILAAQASKRSQLTIREAGQQTLNLVALSECTRLYPGATGAPTRLGPYPEAVIEAELNRRGLTFPPSTIEEAERRLRVLGYEKVQPDSTRH